MPRGTAGAASSSSAPQPMVEPAQASAAIGPANAVPQGPPTGAPRDPGWVVLVDGSADDRKWGAGVAVTDHTMTRLPGDPFASLDVVAGGPMVGFMPRLRPGLILRGDGDALAEAWALAIGLERNLAICREHDLSAPLETLVDRDATLTLLTGGAALALPWLPPFQSSPTIFGC